MTNQIFYRVFKLASAGATSEGNPNPTAINTGMAASLILQRNETTKSLTKGAIMKTKTTKSSSLRFSVNAFALVACAGLGLYFAKLA